MEKPSIDNIRETMSVLHSFEHKIAGSSNERRASEYVMERLQALGFDKIETMTFSVQGWNPQSCRIQVLKPVDRIIEAFPFPYSRSLKTKGTLTRVNHVVEYGATNDGGSIGLSSWGPLLYYSPTRTYYRAAKRGLDAVLITSPDDGDLRKVVVIESGRQLKFPVISISKEDGDFLSSLLEKGEVELEIDVNIETPSDAESMNLEVIIEGQESPDQEICIGTHVDSWFSGAADNCAPVAIILEIARLLQEHVQKGGILRRSVRFLFFGAQNGGTEGFYNWSNGSRAYLDKNKKALGKIIAFLNLSSVGFPKPAQKWMGTTTDLLQFVESLESTSNSTRGFDYYDPPGYGSDHWFFEISGVPSIYGITFPSHLYQTQKDDLDHLDYKVVQDYAEFMNNALFKIANAELLPIDLITPLERFEVILSKYSKMKDCPFDMTLQLLRIRDILAKKSAFKKTLRAIATSGDKKLLRKANRFLSTTTYLFNKTIGWLWRFTEPDDIDYLSRLEMIQDYIALNTSIMSLRGTPVGSLASEHVDRLESFSDNAYNWMSIHKPLARLEKERSKIYKLIEKELDYVSKILTTVENGIKALEN
ncbi:MAG: M28 family peptidase [Candidatus Thorarchaeota archaeon]